MKERLCSISPPSLQMFIDHTFHIIGDAVKKEMTNIFNRYNWDYTKCLKIYLFIIFCTCKIDTLYLQEHVV